MKPLAKFTMQDIRSWNPCYDPNRHLSEDWSGTAIDIVANEKIPFEDVLWVVARECIIDNGLLRRFAAWCAAESLFVTKQTDKRSWSAVEISIKFSIGEASDAELAAARDAARDAARAAARAAAGDAARDAARAAARAAAGDAARDAAWAAQRKKLLSMLREESDFTLSNLLNDYPIERT